MNTKRIIIILLQLLYFHICTAQQDTIQISLDDAIERSLRSNLQVQQAQLRIELAEQDVRQARYDRYPSVVGSMSGGKNWGLNFDQISGHLVTNSITYLSPEIRSTVTVFDGLRNVRQIILNKQRMLIDVTNVEKAKYELTLTVISTYLECLNAKKLGEAAQAQLDLSTEQLRMAETKLGIGTGTRLDMAEIKSLMANDQLHVTETANAYERLLLELRQLMELPPETPISLVEPASAKSLYTAYRTDSLFILSDLHTVDHPSIRLAGMEAEAAKAHIALAKSELYPSLTLGGGYGTNYSSQLTTNIYTGQPLTFWDQLNQNRTYNIYASLSIPIFQNQRARIGIRKAQISYESARNEERIAKNEFYKIISQALLDARTAQGRLRASEAYFEANKEAFEIMQKSYELGRSTIFEVSNVQAKMNQAEFDMIRSEFDLLFKTKIVEFYLTNPQQNNEPFH